MIKINVSLTKEIITKSKKIADFEGIPFTTLYRNWIKTKILEYESNGVI